MSLKNELEIKNKQLQETLDGWLECFQDFKCKSHGGKAPFCIRSRMEKLEAENKKPKELLIKIKNDLWGLKQIVCGLKQVVKSMEKNIKG